jgi:hypothetical protein
MSCVNNSKWLVLQKQVVLATADAGFDGLQFDLNPYAVPPGYNCHCHYCQQGWKERSREVFGIEKPMPGKPADNLAERSLQSDYQIPKGYHVASAAALSPDVPAKELMFNWKEAQGRLLGELNQVSNYVLISVRLTK